jgi:hypothetical protein
MQRTMLLEALHTKKVNPGQMAEMLGNIAGNGCYEWYIDSRKD